MTVVVPPKPTAKPAQTSYLLPISLRNSVRTCEPGVVAVAVVIGLLSGLLVAIISRLSQIAHALLFDIHRTIHLRIATAISWQRLLFAAILG